MIILGLDISSSSTGWAILKHGRFYKRLDKDYGWFLGNKKNSEASNLALFGERVAGLLSTTIDLVVIEDTFFFKNVKVLKCLNRYAGVAEEKCWLEIEHQPLIVPVRSVRAELGTQGKKKKTFDFIVDKYKLNDWSFDTHNDVADALALAYYGHKYIINNR